MDEYKLTFEIEPQVKQRPRVTKWGTYTPKETVEFEKKIKCMAIAQWYDIEKPLEGPLKVRFRFICKKPKKPSKSYPRGDTDNFAKAISDALNEVIWLDDSQIVDERSTKEYGTNGLIEVTVSKHQGPLFFE